MKLTLKEITDTIVEFVYECDFDDLAYLTAECFGGLCEWVEDDCFEFIPNENYGGAFGYEETE